MLGSIRTATQISDAMILQYYEETENKKAGFGKTLSTKQWEDICEIKDLENLFLRKINDYDVLYSIYAKQAA